MAVSLPHVFESPRFLHGTRYSGIVSLFLFIFQLQGLYVELNVVSGIVLVYRLV